MKGQIWTFDMALSLIVFFSALISVLFAWNYISTEIVQTQELHDVQLKALTLSDSLIRTPGIPEDWNNDTVEVIGLAYEDNTLDPYKVQEFVNMSYTKARSMLNVYPYDFFIEIKDINGTVYASTPVPVGSDASIIVPTERYASYMGRIVKFKLVLWA